MRYRSENDETPARKCLDCGRLIDRAFVTQQAVFVHISAVERAGMTNLNEGQKVSFDVVANPKNGKASAENLHAV